MKAMDVVRIARQTDRLNTLELANDIFTDFIELHGDRQYKDDQAIVGGLAYLEDIPVTIVGNQKGVDVEENIRRNFGSAHPEGYRKALRLMKQAEKFNRPVITFVNTAGAFAGVEAENRGQGEAIARNLKEMIQLETPIISVFLGEGGSGGALALAVADEVWMLEFSIYSILSPEGFATILWKDASRSEEAADLMQLTAAELYEKGIIDRVIPERVGDDWIPRDQVKKDLKIALYEKTKELLTYSTDDLLQKRQAKFRNF